MSYESNKYYNETYMQVLQKVLKINNYLWTLYVGIAYLKLPYGNYNRKDIGITCLVSW
jgi:hypothetical protein